MYKDTKVKRKSAMKLKVDHFKQQAEFFRKIFLTMESRAGDLKEFFSHETSSWPPALSSGGLLPTCAKSDLLKCLLDPTTSDLIMNRCRQQCMTSLYSMGFILFIL